MRHAYVRFDDVEEVAAGFLQARDRFVDLVGGPALRENSQRADDQKHPDRERDHELDQAHAAEADSVAGVQRRHRNETQKTGRWNVSVNEARPLSVASSQATVTV